MHDGEIRAEDAAGRSERGRAKPKGLQGLRMGRVRALGLCSLVIKVSEGECETEGETESEASGTKSRRQRKGGHGRKRDKGEERGKREREREGCIKDAEGAGRQATGAHLSRGLVLPVYVSPSLQPALRGPIRALNLSRHVRRVAFPQGCVQKYRMIARSSFGAISINDANLYRDDQHTLPWCPVRSRL